MLYGVFRASTTNMRCGGLGAPSVSYRASSVALRFPTGALLEALVGAGLLRDGFLQVHGDGAHSSLMWTVSPALSQHLTDPSQARGPAILPIHKGGGRSTPPLQELLSHLSRHPECRLNMFTRKLEIRLYLSLYPEVGRRL